jgi:hypothetical protein
MKWEKTLKNLEKRFRWNFFSFGLLVALSSYLSFLIRLNLRANLSSQTTGWFYWLLGRFSLVNEEMNEKRDSRLLLIIFFCFLIRLTVQFALNWGKKCYERMIYVYLIKKVFSLKEQSKELSQKEGNNLIVLMKSASNFSRRFLYLLVSVVATGVDFLLEIYSLYFLIANRGLTGSVRLVRWFTLANITWLLTYRFFLNPIILKNGKEKENRQREEEIKIRFFWENSKTDIPTTSPEKLSVLLDKNSSQLFRDYFFMVLACLPNLVVSGAHILFLLSCYGWQPKTLDWNNYLLALNVQSIILKINQMWELSTSFSSFRRSCFQPEKCIV